MRSSAHHPGTKSLTTGSTAREAAFGTLFGVALLAATTLLCSAARDLLAETDIAMLYLANVVIVAYMAPWFIALGASAGAVALFDLFFVQPLHTFAVRDARYLATFGVMAATGLLVSFLASRLRDHRHRAERRATRLRGLNALAHDLVRVSDEAGVRRALEQHAETVLGDTATLSLPERMSADADPDTGDEPRVEILVAGEARPGVPIVEACTAQLSSALRRVKLEHRAREALVKAQSERLRNAVLSSVSHDLRSPLGSILGAASTLLDRPEMPPTDRHGLTRSIEREARRLARHLDNLLQMTRIDGGAFVLRREWVSPAEVLEPALRGIGSRAAPVRIRIDGPPLVHVDPVAMESSVCNLVDNALRHGAAPIEVVSSGTEEAWRLQVLDSGPGVPIAERERIFGKFERGAAAPGTGTGLGLAIVRAVVRAHGGEVWAEGREGGGADIGFSLPFGEPVPEIVPEATLTSDG